MIKCFVEIWPCFAYSLIFCRFPLIHVASSRIAGAPGRQVGLDSRPAACNCNITPPTNPFGPTWSLVRRSVTSGIFMVPYESLWALLPSHDWIACGRLGLVWSSSCGIMPVRKIAVVVGAPVFKPNWSWTWWKGWKQSKWRWKHRSRAVRTSWRTRRARLNRCIVETWLVSCRFWYTLASKGGFIWTFGRIWTTGNKGWEAYDWRMCRGLFVHGRTK